MARQAEFKSPKSESDPDAFLVRRIHGVEELGRLPSYDIDLLRPSRLDVVDASDMLGKTAAVELAVGDGSEKRWLQGYITHFELFATQGNFDLYRITLRPWLFFLTLSSNCRVFQSKSALDIIQAVFAEYSGTVKTDGLSTTYRQREYTLQYRESDFAFVSRLMEAEGIYYYFDYTASSNTLVLCDNTGQHTKKPEDRPLRWADKQRTADNQESSAADDVIQRWRRSRSVRSLKYAHTDYDYELPGSSLATNSDGSDELNVPGTRKRYDWPGGYDDLAQTQQTGQKTTEGSRLAGLEVARFKVQSDLATALTSSRALACGYKFEFKDHRTDAGEWLVTHLEMEAEYGGYEGDEEKVAEGMRCRVEAIPATNRFRPERFTEVPLIPGAQTAVVVGKSGDEITTDKLGRIKVKFHWDVREASDETVCCWVRVSQAWASKGFGAVFLPRIGDEVVVSFLEGNPDRPLVTGCVYNGNNLPPYTLPAQATVSGMKSRSSTGGDASKANELRFDDKSGSEYVWFQAQKDFHRLVKNDAFDTVQNNDWKDVTKSASLKIGENQTVDIGKALTLQVGTDANATVKGDLVAGVNGKLNLTVNGAVAASLGDALALSTKAGTDVNVGAALAITASSSVGISGKNIVIDGGPQLTLMAGGCFIVLGSSGIAIMGSKVQINTGGSPGNATPAQSANPPTAKAPDAPTANKDPLASGDGGSGLGS